MEPINKLNEFIRGVVGYDLPQPHLLEIILALTLSFALMCLISAVYKKTYRGSDYSQDYVHTLIILGTVVCVVIMVVRGDAATAFGMFAAFSIIRFRRSVRQSRDIGFIFLAMAAGLGVGARQYGLATMTTVIAQIIATSVLRRLLRMALIELLRGLDSLTPSPARSVLRRPSRRVRTRREWSEGSPGATIHRRRPSRRA